MANPKTAAHTGSFDAAAFERAFLSADYIRCRDIVAAAPSDDETALALSRVDLRDRRPLEVIERLSNLRPTDSLLRAERDVWLGAALGVTGDGESARHLFDRAIEALQPPQELYYAALFQKAHLHWMERRWAPLEALVRQLLDAPHAGYRGRGYMLRGWIRGGKQSDAHAHARDYLRALDEFELMPQPDRQFQLDTLVTLASLARELGLESAAQRVRIAYEGMHPTSGMHVQYFKLTRILGWIDALAGNELSAFRRFRQARDLAPNDLWRVQCISDRATLARAAGERAFAHDQLYAAHDLASRLSWSDAVEEDRITLLNLAKLFGDVDGAVAQRYLAQFRSLRTPMDRRMGLANDPRMRALELSSSGTTMLRLGEPGAARDMLIEAHEIFSRFGYGWRAAQTALGVYEAAGDERWLRVAEKAIERWPNSWIAREIRAARQSPTAHEARVTRAQRPILRLVLEGRRNAEIARAIGKSPNTVRNHIVEIFRTFDVRSRSELIALLSRRDP